MKTLQEEFDKSLKQYFQPKNIGAEIVKTQVSRKHLTPPCAAGLRRLNLRWICGHGSK